MTKKVKPSESQVSLFNTPDLPSKEDQEYHEGRETQKAERQAAPDDDPVLTAFREAFISEHIARYPDGLCAYFRYDFRKEDYQ